MSSGNDETREFRINNLKQTQEQRKQDSQNDDEYDVLVNGLTQLAELPIIIDDTPATQLTPSKVRSVLRRIVSERGELGLVVLDYIQKLGDRAAGNRAQTVGKFSGAFKDIAKEFDVPFTSSVFNITALTTPRQKSKTIIYSQNLFLLTRSVFVLEPPGSSRNKLWVETQIKVQWLCETSENQELKQKVREQQGLNGNPKTLATLLEEGLRKKCLQVRWETIDSLNKPKEVKLESIHTKTGSPLVLFVD